MHIWHKTTPKLVVVWVTCTSSTFGRECEWAFSIQKCKVITLKFKMGLKTITWPFQSWVQENLLRYPISVGNRVLYVKTIELDDGNYCSVAFIDWYVDSTIQIVEVWHKKRKKIWKREVFQYPFSLFTFSFIWFPENVLNWVHFIFEH